ncbi:MAG: hypothetical protein RSG52_02120 [Terrisporobacter sp.]|uniref:hypothetical protein n=1 Tax=Terrisporobacter sp. TaxID=1965305 RepID=UPI002FCC1A52
MKNVIDEKQIKQKLVSCLEGIVCGLIFLIVNFFISCIPEIIPFEFDFDVFGCALTILILFKSFCALYYANKLK